MVLVSSGAVAEGMVRLGIDGTAQCHLDASGCGGGRAKWASIQQYQTCFDVHQMKTAQVLLTHSDLRARDRYLNARNTLVKLLALGVVPIVNENDTVVTDEIRFGDNDTLAAMVANLIDAKALGDFNRPEWACMIGTRERIRQRRSFLKSKRATSHSMTMAGSGRQVGARWDGE